MKPITTFACTSAALLLALSATPAAADGNGHHNNREYEVTITNASATSFTPILAVAHKAGVKLFAVGTQASEGLAEIAESGSPAGLVAELALQSGEVGGMQTSAGLLGPGESIVLELAAGPRFHELSLASMLLPTNDSFVGLSGVALPNRRGHALTYHALGYDAGSETNDELCVHIPGPQCGGAGEGSSPDDAGEGYVRVSPGIAGGGDLSSGEYDWRNPVAIVTVKRVN